MFELTQQSEAWWKQLFVSLDVYPINCTACDYHLLISRDYAAQSSEITCPNCLNKMQITAHNLRKIKRYANKVQLTLSQNENKSMAISMDLSNLGAQIVSDLVLDPQQNCNLSCESFKAVGKIAWQKNIANVGACAYGIQFISFTPTGAATFVSVKI